MVRSVVSALGMCAAAVALTACDVAKSSNPLSPTIAGPIPGINISAPKPLEPAVGSKIAVDQQPVTLIIENSGSNSVRPLSYVFEVATDADFSNKVFARDSISPGDGGRTSLKLPDPLATGRTYYWRARAQDGANASDYSAGVNFNVFTPIVIGEPDPREPAVNTTVGGLRPRFVVGNAPHSGPVGAIVYQMELSDNDSFANKIAVVTQGEQSGQTTLELPADLNYSAVYYWHVRATDPATAGPWSRIYAFATPAPAPVAPPPITPGPPGVPDGPIPADAFNLAGAVAHNSPSPGGWPATTALRSISFRSDGVAVEFGKKNGAGRWPDVVPPGWSGPIQYTLWIAMNIGGTWHVAGAIEFWHDLAAGGGDVTRNNQVANNWTYDCGPMARQPAPGEMVGFFVTAGDQRKKDAAITHERSNVVLVPFPGSAGQSYSFGLPGFIGGLR